MEFLFGSQNGTPKHSYVEGFDFRYDAWQVNGIWHQQLQVNGRKAGPIKRGFVESTEANRVLATLVDEEVMLWEHLDLAKRGVGPGNIGGFFVFLCVALVICVFLLAAVYAVTMTVLAPSPWYLKYPLYPLAIVFSIAIPLLFLIVREKIVLRSRLKVLLRFLKDLQSRSGRNTSYYESILLKIANSKDQVRAKTAQMLLDKGLI